MSFEGGWPWTRLPKSVTRIGHRQRTHPVHGVGKGRQRAVSHRTVAKSRTRAGAGTSREKGARIQRFERETKKKRGRTARESYASSRARATDGASISRRRRAHFLMRKRSQADNRIEVSSSLGRMDFTLFPNFRVTIQPSLLLRYITMSDPNRSSPTERLIRYLVGFQTSNPMRNWSCDSVKCPLHIRALVRHIVRSLARLHDLASILYISTSGVIRSGCGEQWRKYHTSIL